MVLETRVWLYGSRPEKSKPKKKISAKKPKGKPAPKKLVRLNESEIRFAKAFHVFVKDSKGNWKRVSPELEIIPKDFDTKTDKQIYVESYLDTIQQEAIARQKTLKPKKKKERLEFPEFPKEDRVSITKKEFSGQMSRIIMDELFNENTQWSDDRIDSFIDKLWKRYSNEPHLLLSETFRRGLVTTELETLKREEAERRRESLQDVFKKELQVRGTTFNTDIKGQVNFQVKEVFNKQNMRSEDEQTMPGWVTDEKGKMMMSEVPRQKAFAQITVDYEKKLLVNRDDLEKISARANAVTDVVREDIKKVFTEALQKGVFSAGEGEEYSVRLLVPLLDSRGRIPSEYKDLEGKKTSGYGYSTERMTVEDEEDVDDILDNLFEDLLMDLGKYASLNNSAGVGFAGFMIERLLG